MQSCEIASLDATRDPGRFLVAWCVAHVADRIAENPSNACLNAAYAPAIGRFGPEVHFTPPNDVGFQPEWRLAVNAELRWQIARLLRCRLGYI